MHTPTAHRRWPLILGDSLTLAGVTAAGFATHNLIGTASASRLMATFLPFLAAWLLAAGAVGALDLDRAGEPRQLWRPVIAGLLAAPLGAVLRGVWIGAPILPLFVGIMAGTITLALLVWRLVYLVLRRRSQPRFDK